MVFLVSRVRDGFSLTPPAGDTHSPRQMLILFSVDSPTVLPNSAILRIAGRARRVCLLCRRGGEGSLGIPCECAQGLESCGRETITEGAVCGRTGLLRERFLDPWHEKVLICVEQ